MKERTPRKINRYRPFLDLCRGTQTSRAAPATLYRRACYRQSLKLLLELFSFLFPLVTLPDMFSKLREIKDKASMAKRMMDLQKKVAEISVDGTSGWGKVKVSVNGLQKMQSCWIDHELLADKGKLEGLIVDAVNDAHTKLQKIMAERMKDTSDAGFSEFGDLLKG